MTISATSSELFEAWSLVRDNPNHQAKLAGVRALGKHGRHQAELIWKKWVLFCAENAISWGEATPNHFRMFNEGIAPRRATRPDAVMLKASPTTQRRYWRTLHDIYSHAVVSGYLQDNPAQNEDALGIPHSEVRESLVLPSNYWNLLNDAVAGGFTFRDVRDRVLMLLIMRAGLTVGEIVAIRKRDVKAHPMNSPELQRYGGLPLFERDLNWQANEPHPIYALEVTSEDGKRRPAKHRTLVLDARTSKAIFDWLKIRSQIKRVPLESDFLLLGTAVSDQITTRSIFKVCCELFNRVSSAEKLTIQHPCPNTLRNTRIDLWRKDRSLTEDEVSRRVGVVPGSIGIRMPAIKRTFHLGAQRAAV